jgi:hypothetical protein
MDSVLIVCETIYGAIYSQYIANILSKIQLVYGKYISNMQGHIWIVYKYYIVVHEQYIG